MQTQNEGFNSPYKAQIFNLKEQLKDVNAQIEVETVKQTISTFFGEETASTLSETQIEKIFKVKEVIQSKHPKLDTDVATMFAYVDGVVSAVDVGYQGLLARGVTDSMIEMFTGKDHLKDLESDEKRKDSYFSLVKESIRKEIVAGKTFSEAFFDGIQEIREKRKSAIALVNPNEGVVRVSDVNIVYLKGEGEDVVEGGEPLHRRSI